MLERLHRGAPADSPSWASPPDTAAQTPDMGVDEPSSKGPPEAVAPVLAIIVTTSHQISHPGPWILGCSTHLCALSDLLIPGTDERQDVVI